MRQRIGVAIRADASRAIGAGHVMRCMALAQALRQRGERVAFVCRERPGHLLEVIRGRGFEGFALPATGDDVPETLGVPVERDVTETLAALGGPVRRMVVDHYGAGEAWERAARAAGVARIVVVDDLPRRHDCDALVDVNLSADESEHDRLVPATADLLLGPSFAMLAPEFAACRERATLRGGRPRRILVSFGGGDVAEPTAKVLAAAGAVDLESAELDVIVPEESPGREAIAEQVRTLPRARLFGRVSDMAERMVEADFMLGAAGGQALERCCLGLPAAVMTIAANQEAPARALERAGVCLVVGRQEDTGVMNWAIVLGQVCTGELDLRRMSRLGMELVDGEGADRVADAVLAGAQIGVNRDRVRPMDERDVENVWRWRNREEVRRVMFSTGEIAREDHLRWFDAHAHTAGMRALVYESAGTALGFVKFEDFDPATGSCAWGFYVGPPDAPRGTGSRMGWLALTYAFDDLGVASVKGVVTATNERSLRYHDRLGFTRAGDSTREGSSGTVPVVEYELTAGHWREVADRLRTEIFGG